MPECPSNDPQLLLLIGYVFLCTRDRNLQCTVDTEISSTVSFRSLPRCVDMVTIVALLHQASISGANLGFRFGAFDRAQLQNVRRGRSCLEKVPVQGFDPQSRTSAIPSSQVARGCKDAPRAAPAHQACRQKLWFWGLRLHRVSNLVWMFVFQPQVFALVYATLFVRKAVSIQK